MNGVRGRLLRAGVLMLVVVLCGSVVAADEGVAPVERQDIPEEIRTFVGALKERQGLRVTVTPESAVTAEGFHLRGLVIMHDDRPVAQLEDVRLDLDVARAARGFAAVRRCVVTSGTVDLERIDRLTRALMDESVEAAKKEFRPRWKTLTQRRSWFFDFFEEAGEDEQVPEAGERRPLDLPDHDRLVEFEGLSVSGRVGFIFSSVPYTIEHLTGSVTASGTEGRLVSVKGFVKAEPPIKLGRLTEDVREGVWREQSDQPFDLTRLGDPEARGDIIPEVWKALTFIGYMFGGRPVMTEEPASTPSAPRPAWRAPAKR